MRCSISNPRKLKQLSRRTGLNVVRALTRGNTGHRIDFATPEDKGYPYSLYPDDTLVKRTSDYGDVIWERQLTLSCWPD